MMRLTLTGNTFSIKGELKAQGFKWNAVKKAWYKDFEAAEDAQRLVDAYEDAGVYGALEKVVEKRYMVKEDWIFNLESMDDKIWCLIYDIREGKVCVPFEVAGKTINDEDDLLALLDEASALESKAKSNRGVTGKEYGRIKAIVSWRVMARYNACIAAGMDESEAGLCFSDI